MAVELVMPSTDVEDSLISVNYDGTGKAWADVFENTIFGWGIDPADLGHPIPIILGSLPPVAPDTMPTFSPQWLWRRAKNNVLIAADIWRGNGAQFFEYLAKNGGAQRKLRNFAPSLQRDYDEFKRQNPTLIGG
jgi:hypothetical protein